MAIQQYDALIIGAGPAGSTCAWKLQQAGLNVLVIDKKRFPRDKPCAGWITPQVVDTLQLDLTQYAQSLVLQPITGFLCGMIGGRDVPVDYDHVISYGIRRCEFDNYLLMRSGAPYQLGQPVARIERREHHWLINETYAAPLLIGAGGNFCPIARHLGSHREEGVQSVAAQEVEFIATNQQLEVCPVSASRPELFFCRDLAGYGWFFRKGNVLNIGLGRMDPERISAHVSEFCAFLRERGKLPFEIPTRFVGHAYRLYAHHVPKLVDDGVLLIGDSAGLAFAKSGEGIRPAIESALLAADTIINSQSNYSRSSL